MNKIAVIDIGSNSVRLMRIADGNVLYKMLKTTRLGEGLAFSPQLKDEAIARTVDAISAFVEQAKTDEVDGIYAYATAAVRSAKNGREFVDKVYSVCGVKVEIISGEEEARIGILGALGKKDGAIIDIGGASTELIIQKNESIVYEKSLNIGVVRIRDLCGRDKDKVLELSKSMVKEYGLEKVTGKVYAIGGTATTLGAISQGLLIYEPKLVTGARITKEKIAELSHKLFSMTVEEIEKMPCVDKLRADVLAGGVEWLSVMMDELKIPEIIVSDGDNLEGYAISRGLLNER
jgi:exopolyphosphatase/guanosine-5'-triphosphate,3'-diphosphate pyrophosphatase